MAMTPRGWSISALSVELRMDRRTIAKRISHLQPVDETGNAKLYALAEVVEALTAAGAERAAPDNFEDARTRKTAAEAILAEIEVEKARGRVVEVAVMEAVIGEQLAAVRARLLAMPSALATEVATSDDPAECQDIMNRGIAEALEELSSDRDLAPPGPPGRAGAAGDDPGEDDEPPAAAPAKRKRVGRSVPKAEPGRRRGKGAVEHGPE